jgi:hypothetical protein
MIKITLGRDGSKWVAVDTASGQQMTFGSRKPSHEAILTALRRQVGTRPAVNEEVQINELSDAS